MLSFIVHAVCTDAVIHARMLSFIGYAVTKMLSFKVHTVIKDLIFIGYAFCTDVFIHDVLCIQRFVIYSIRYLHGCCYS